MFDGTNFSEGSFEFARQLNKLQPLLVTGVFLPQVDYANLWSYASAAGAGAGVAAYIPLLEEDESEEVMKNIHRFESLCEQHHVRYRVHKDFFDFGLPEVKKESRFADVVVVGGELFYKGVPGGSQFEYMRDVLHATESPVLVVPEHYQFPDTIILTYDGSEESVYAIKQFAYLFPELTSKKTILVYASDKTGQDFPSKKGIIELASQHYPDLQFYKLELTPKNYFTSWVGDKKGALVVSGSFGRSAFSQLFRRSFVADVIKAHNLPVFIAHK